MAADRDPMRNRAADLGRRVRAARLLSKDLLADAIRTAYAVATTHENVAETLEILAARKPDRATELLATSATVRTRAQRHRQMG